MTQLFRPRANALARAALLAVAAAPFLLLFVHVALMRTPYFTRQGNRPEQPVPFSHKHHVTEMGLDCRFCHNAVETSARAGIPPTHVCMGCHSQLFTKAEMLAPVRESYATGKPLRWQQVNRLPDYVYFNHAVHVRNGVGCTTCHGPIDQMPLVYQARPLTMGWCISCHRNPGRFLRKPSEVFATDWQPHDDPAEIRKLIAHYMINTAHLTDCSACHR